MTLIELKLIQHQTSNDLAIKG